MVFESRPLLLRQGAHLFADELHLAAATFVIGNRLAFENRIAYVFWHRHAFHADRARSGH